MDKESLKKKIAKNLEIPREYIENILKVSIIGQNEIIIENYKSLIEYENDIICVNTKDKLIKIQGSGLTINSITDEEIIIKGEVLNISFE